MTTSEPTETKLARDLQVGDRICYKSGQLDRWADNGYANRYIELSGQVLKVETCFDGRKYILTPSGWLKPLLSDAEVTIAPPDYDVEIVQRQYDVEEAEIYAGRSIE
jgi:hypothetical protein